MTLTTDRGNTLTEGCDNYAFKNGQSIPPCQCPVSSRPHPTGHPTHSTDKNGKLVRRSIGLPPTTTPCMCSMLQYIHMPIEHTNKVNLIIQCTASPVMGFVRHTNSNPDNGGIYTRGKSHWAIYVQHSIQCKDGGFVSAVQVMLKQRSSCSSLL